MAKLIGGRRWPRRVFLINGRAPEWARSIATPKWLARWNWSPRAAPTRSIAGAIAQAIVRTSEKARRLFDLSDFAEYSAEWVPPISTEYHGWKVYELPPNGQGIAALMMLNIMERFPLAEWGVASPDTWHVKIEAQKLAYQDLHRFVADPRQAKVPLPECSRRSTPPGVPRSSTQRARCDVAPGNPPAGGRHHLSFRSMDGNIVSLIQSVYQGFGSG